MHNKFILALTLLLLPSTAFAQEGPSHIQVLLAGPFGALCVGIFGIIGLACFLFSGGGNSNTKKVGSAESMLVVGSLCLVVAVVVYFKRVNFEHQKLKFSEEQKAMYNIY